MRTDYDMIKNKYGENFARLCRNLFPTILEEKGALTKIITDNFAPTHALAEDLQRLNLCSQFKSYIYNHYLPKDHNPVETDQTPEALMAQAGYILYPECQTEADIQQFKKYYSTTHRETLCTFKGDRLLSNRVWFAVKENVDQINREDFPDPDRQDAYGTSVISIQFTKDPHRQTLSIKNRYNHTVLNPDSTFANNLDNIIAGLTKAFEKYYDCRDVNSHHDSFEIPGYVQARNGKYYRENLEVNNISYCENNTLIINGYPYTLSGDHQIIADTYLIDWQHLQIANISDPKVIAIDHNQLTFNTSHPHAEDGFTKSFGNIKKITVNKNHTTGGKIITVYSLNYPNPICFHLDQHSQITEYHHQDLTKTDKNFLYYNKALHHATLPKLTRIDNGFLSHNLALSELSLPQVTDIKERFMAANCELKQLDLPQVVHLGNYFLCRNNTLTYLDLPQVTTIGDGFLMVNRRLYHLDIPQVTEIGSNFLMENKSMTHLDLPQVTQIGDSFLLCNTLFTKLSLPQVTRVGEGFLSYATQLAHLDLPQITQVGSHFLSANQALKEVYLPKAVKIGKNFLYQNQILTSLKLPHVKTMGASFLHNNRKLRPDGIYLPELENIESEGIIDFCVANNPHHNAIIDKLERQIELNTQPKPHKLHHCMLQKITKMFTPSHERN